MSAKIALLPYKDQWQEIDVANRIIAGNHVLDNGYLRVSDFFPVDFHNPEITVNLRRHNIDLIHFNETELILNGDKIKFNPENIDLNITLDKVKSIYTYKGNNAALTREVEVTYSQRVVITYNITLIDGSVANFKVNQLVPVSPDVDVTNKLNPIINEDEKVLRLSLIDLQGQKINTTISLSETNGIISNVEFEPNNSYCNFTIITTGVNLHLKYEVSAEPIGQPIYSSLEYSNSYDLLRSHNINYLILNKEGVFGRDVYRYKNDSEHFEQTLIPKFENRKVIILQVGSD
jgi:hypothetical protein